MRRSVSVALFLTIALAVLLALQIGASGSGCPAPSFASPLNFPSGTVPRFVVIGDFNADGKPDLAITNQTSATVSILLGDGAGNFGSPASFAVGSGPRFVAVADFNRDGKLDLAVANQDSNTISSTILEACTGAGVQGWGWADNEWCGTGVTIYFANDGWHTLRVQQREDGVSIDQIVLSPQTYLRSSPGALKNDATILPKNTNGF